MKRRAPRDRLSALFLPMLLTAGLLLAPAPLAALDPERAGRDLEAESVERDVTTVAIGDVHGDFRTFFELLRSLELVGPDGHWTGGERRLVQTGDLLDRGPASRRVVELLMRLEKEAPPAGGAVKVLLGNHEAMNLMGDLQCVSAAEVASFAADESAELREERREAILSLVENGHPLLRSDFWATHRGSIDSRTFDARFPPGYFAHRRAYTPQHEIGKWLLGLDAVHVEKEILFVHGGISPRLASLSPAEINRRVRLTLETYFEAVEELEELGVFVGALGWPMLVALMDAERAAGEPAAALESVFRRLDAVRESILLAGDGPLWYRGLALSHERRFRPRMERILELQGVRRIVVGHTRPESLAVRGRFGNRLILIDTGMNQAFYGGRPSALLVESAANVRVFE